MSQKKSIHFFIRAHTKDDIPQKFPSPQINNYKIERILSTKLQGVLLNENFHGKTTLNTLKTKFLKI